MSTSSSPSASASNSNSGAPATTDDTSLSRTSDNSNKPSDEVPKESYFSTSPSDNPSSKADFCTRTRPKRFEPKHGGKRSQCRHYPSERGLGARRCLRCCGLGTISSHCGVCNRKGEVYASKFKEMQDCEPCYGTGTVRDEKVCKRCTGAAAFFPLRRAF